jgi:predicted GIY-YIG superfamily endonuclease
MLGKNFVYVLMRKDGKCFKIGHTGDLPRRLRRLNRHYGPFTSARSYVLRTATKQHARKLEDALRTLLMAYRIRLPIGHKSDGQTEWFTGRSFELLAQNRDSILAPYLGVGGMPLPVDVETIAPLSKAHRARLRRVQKVIDRIDGQLLSRWENAQGTKGFINWITARSAAFLGTAKTIKDDGDVCFELFLKPGSCSQDELRQIQGFPLLTSSEGETYSFAATNFGIQTSSVREYQKVELKFEANQTMYEESWDSCGFVKEMEAICEDLYKEIPLPPEYRQYVGVHFLDRLTQAQRQELSRAFVSWLSEAAGLS